MTPNRTDVYPDFGAVNVSGELSTIAGALLTIVLVVSVLMLVVCAATWALSSAAGNYQGTAKARAGVWVSCGTAALAGAGVIWLNFLIKIGSNL